MRLRIRDFGDNPRGNPPSASGGRWRLTSAVGRPLCAIAVGNAFLRWACAGATGLDQGRYATGVVLACTAYTPLGERSGARPRRRERQTAVGDIRAAHWH